MTEPTLPTPAPSPRRARHPEAGDPPEPAGVAAHPEPAPLEVTASGTDVSPVAAGVSGPVPAALPVLTGTRDREGIPSVSTGSLHLERGGIGEATAGSVEVRMGGIGRVDAEDVHVAWGGIGAASARTMSVEFGSVGAAMAGELRVTQGMVSGVIAREATVEQGFVRTLIAQHVTINRPSGVLLMIAGRVDGDVRPVLDWRGALAAGLGLGLVSAVVTAFRKR